MADRARFVAEFIGTIERLLLPKEPDRSMDWCLFRIWMRDDSKHRGSHSAVGSGCNGRGVLKIESWPSPFLKLATGL